jgi:hypothetical protein
MNFVNLLQGVIGINMNIIEYKADLRPIISKVCFCLIDNTHRYPSAWAKELIKNQADFSISNITSKGYDIFQSQHEAAVLRYVSNRKYTHAVVFSTGTEFINGRAFFEIVEELLSSRFLVAGHILDRGDAYYELHHQCYIINLVEYSFLNYPIIGNEALGTSHQQTAPVRSAENFHDNYTPKTINGGDVVTHYNHKLHGWNILRVAFENSLPVLVFDNSIRINKKHYYPENQLDFLKNIQWAYQRYNYCATEFVHADHTDTIDPANFIFNQIITPASGLWFSQYLGISPVHVIMYDYNQKSLDYWKINVPLLENVTYEFIKVDLLTDNIYKLVPDLTKVTLFNITNIFCYEGTAMMYSLEYRLSKELELMANLPNNWTLLASDRSWGGFSQVVPGSISDLTKPTWHMNGDWNE